MSYQRTIPRDLFNEAKLLKCLGQLSLLIYEGLSLEHDNTEFAGFSIAQDERDGSLYCENISLFYCNRLIGLRSPYNCKNPFPLRFILDEDCGNVFDDSGEFSTEFISSIDKIL